MFPTGKQLSNGIRKLKIRRNKVSAFHGAPCRKGIVYKIAVMSPRKPNSARRTFAKVRIGHGLQQKKIFAKYRELVNIFYKHIRLFLFVVMGQKILQV